MFRFLHSLVWMLLLMHLFIMVPFAWLLKDGLGPSSVPTSGMESFKQAFMTFYTGPILIVLVMAVIGMEVIKRGVKGDSE